jgi:glycerol-3-phosphate dehydrogenase
MQHPAPVCPLRTAMASCAVWLSAGQRKAVYVENMMTGERQMLHADCVINAAGLWAQVP